MIVPRGFANQDVGVFGLARTGISTVRALIAGGARVYAWDDGEASRHAAEELGGHALPLESWPWHRLTVLILSPGVPLTHPAPHTVVNMADKARVPVIGDMELFARQVRPRPEEHSLAPVVAVTGTNGKSTTTALIGHILSYCGCSVQMGGNIGNPVLDLEPPGAQTVYVLEVSSYQIELSPGLSPDVAVLTNISPDHLDRHGSMESYATVKGRLLKQASRNGIVFIGVDDAYSAAIQSSLAAGGAPNAIPVSVGKVLGRGVFVIDGILYDAQAANAARVMDLRNAAHLHGAHNWQNAALAYAATSGLVKNRQAIADAIATFPGLPHRTEDVGQIGKVCFINDSKATNADAAERALKCFGDIFWIAGGRPKEGGIESLAPLFQRIRKAYLIGEAADEFARTLGDTPHAVCDTLQKAVATALHDARASNVAAPVVLLSPACASFDQFRDYEQRGNVFRALVRELSSDAMREAS